jgi:hypothetical protein
VLRCGEVPPSAGAKAATDITANFSTRVWLRNVVGAWDGGYRFFSSTDYSSIVLEDEYRNLGER